MSIRSKFVLILIFCLAALAAGVSFAARHFAAQEADAVFSDKASAQLDRVDDMLHIYFKGAEQAVKKLAALPGIQDIASARADSSQAAGVVPSSPLTPGRAEMDAALVQVLAALPSLVPGVEAAFCGYKNGSFHSSSRTPQGEYDARTQSWYSDTAWGAAETSITDIAISDVTKSLAATVAAKIKDNAGQTLGVAALTVNMASLTDTLRDVRLGETGFLVLFDAKGRVLFDPKVQENLLRPASEAGPLLLTAMQLPAGEHPLEDGDTPFVVYSRVFSDSRWKAALIMEEAERSAPGTRLILAVSAVAAAAAVVLALIGIALAFGATRPLYALINQSKSLADGNTEALAGIAGRGPDVTALQGNIGRLMGRVMLLAQAERDHAGELETYARKAVAAEQTQGAHNAAKAGREACRSIAENLAPLAAEAASGTSAAAGWMNTLHGLVRDQMLAARNTRTATLALVDDTATMAGQAVETEKTAETALELARRADKLSRDAAHAAEALEDAARALTPGLEAFRTDTAHIAAQTAAMRDIAEEINVLGLKLSIEVSGAGEAGKKFAPVTEEMRALAEKTMAATGVMDSLVAAFEQTQAAHSLAAGKNATAAKRTVSGSAKTSAALAQTAAAMFTTVEQVRVLSTALEGLAQTDGQEIAQADAALDAAHGTGEALKVLDGHVASLTALADKLAAFTNELANAPLNGMADGKKTPAHGAPYLAAQPGTGIPQKQLD